jgi:hypothetical protein
MEVCGSEFGVGEGGELIKAHFVSLGRVAVVFFYLLEVGEEDKSAVAVLRGREDDPEAAFPLRVLVGPACLMVQEEEGSECQQQDGSCCLADHDINLSKTL